MMDCKSGTATGKGGSYFKATHKNREKIQTPHRTEGGMEMEVAVAERKTSGTRALHSKKKNNLTSNAYETQGDGEEE